MSVLFSRVSVLMGLVASLCNGQSLLDEANFKASELGGIRLQGISLFTGYSTSAYPQAGLGFNQAGAGGLDGDATYGASFSLGWQRHSRRTNVSILYFGSYSGMVRYSNTNGYSQNVAFNASRQLGPKWALNISGTAQDSTVAQFLYQPSALTVLSQTPTSFDNLAAAFSIGQFTNAQMAAALTGAPILESPARSLLLGTRVLSYGAQASLSYAYSSRLSFHFASLTAGGQNRTDQNTAGQLNYVMPRTLGANAGMGFTYMLSPRTTIGFNLDENGLTNSYQKGYTTNTYVSIGRKMGMHWFLRGQAGGSSSHLIQQQYGPPPNSLQLNGGASLGYQTYSHTVLASYNRSSIDDYGFAIGTSSTLTGAWNWRRPGNRWGLFASYSSQQMRNTGFASISGWQVTGGVSNRVSDHMTVAAQYVYLNSTGNYYVGGLSSLAIQSVRLSLNWSPQIVDGTSQRQEQGIK